MKTDRAQSLVLALVALCSLALLLLAFAAGVRSDGAVALGLLLSFPVAAALVAFRTPASPVAIAAAFVLPAALIALWSSALGGSTRTGLVWLANFLGLVRRSVARSTFWQTAEEGSQS